MMEASFEKLLVLLAEAKVDFIVVGGNCGFDSRLCQIHGGC
jgi:hypothetical protein